MLKNLLLDEMPAPVEHCNLAWPQAAAVGAWIAQRLREGCATDEVGILILSQGEVARARAAVKAAGAKSTEFNEKSR